MNATAIKTALLKIREKHESHDQSSHGRRGGSGLSIGGKLGKYEIVGIKRVKHGKFFPNREITHKVYFRGPRGSRKWGYAFQSGKIGRLTDVQYDVNFFEGEGVLDGTG